MEKPLKKPTTKKSNLVLLGKSPAIAPDVSLGVWPERLQRPSALIIGDHAIIRSGTIIYLNSRIGDFLQTGHHAIIREENEIGNYFSIWSGSVLDYGCKIGNRVKIHTLCYIAQYTLIEDDVFLAPGVIIANDYHPASNFSKSCVKGPIIKKGAQIGCNATLLPFITIGEHCLIGAGSVVTQNIPPYSVACGNPARVVKKINDVRCPVSLHVPYDFQTEL